MALKTDPLRLYSEKSGMYDRFISSVGYPQGLRAYFVNSRLLRPGLRILDAGCGTGVLTLAVRDALRRRDATPSAMNAFDLTPAMLDRFKRVLDSGAVDGVELAQCDVRHLNALPNSWTNYDLIVSASMMEYLPKDEFSDALRALRALLNDKGTLVLFITRDNLLTRPLIGHWWQSNLYKADELRRAFSVANFAEIRFGRFPFPYGYLNLWGYAIEASLFR